MPPRQRVNLVAARREKRASLNGGAASQQFSSKRINDLDHTMNGCTVVL
jgi:hypothetical protein